MQIIGLRPTSTFRVPADWYLVKPRFAPGVDPTTGGPVVVVHDNTDTHAEGYLVDHDPNSPSHRQVIKAAKPEHHAHLARTVGAALGHIAREAGAAALEAGAQALEAGEGDSP